LRIAFISEWVRELQKKRTLVLEHIHGIFMFVCVHISLEMLMVFWCRWIQFVPPISNMRRNRRHLGSMETWNLHGWKQS
jgi:hypothetical protein